MVLLPKYMYQYDADYSTPGFFAGAAGGLTALPLGRILLHRLLFLIRGLVINIRNNF
jgi:hypothetical protein